MRPDQAVIRVESVTYAYESLDPHAAPTVALEDVSLCLRRGEMVGVIGQNGSGKTTLARHLNGLLKPDTGRVLVGDTDTRDAEPGRLAATVGYVFQNPDHALFLPSVRQEIEYGLNFLDLDEDERERRVVDALERFGLTSRADRHPASFGRGLRRLVVLAAAHAMAPDVLVLDEPTGGLDARLTAGLAAILQELVREGRTVLLISHDMQLVAETCDRVVALHRGRLVADASPGELFRQGELLDRIGIPPPQIAQLSRRLESHGLGATVTTAEEFVDVVACAIQRRRSGTGQ